MVSHRKITSCFCCFTSASHKRWTPVQGVVARKGRPPLPEVHNEVVMMVPNLSVTHMDSKGEARSAYQTRANIGRSEFGKWFCSDLSAMDYSNKTLT